MKTQIMAVAVMGTFSFGAAANDEFTHGFYVTGSVQRVEFEKGANNIWRQDGHAQDLDLKDVGYVYGLGYEWKYARFEYNARRLGEGKVRSALNQADDEYYTCAAAGHCSMATGANRTSYKVRGESVDLLIQYPIGSVTPYLGMGMFNFRLTSHTEAWVLGKENECWKETIHAKGKTPIYRGGFTCRSICEAAPF